jgi:hypothetical protein
LTDCISLTCYKSPFLVCVYQLGFAQARKEFSYAKSEIHFPVKIELQQLPEQTPINRHIAKLCVILWAGVG